MARLEPVLCRNLICGAYGYRFTGPPHRHQVVNRAPIPHRAMHFQPIRHRSCDEPTVATS
jgi:hypothetical protein